MMLMAGGSATSVIFTPLSILLIVIDVAMLIWPFWGSIKKLFKKKGAEA